MEGLRILVAPATMQQMTVAAHDNPIRCNREQGTERDNEREHAMH